MKSRLRYFDPLTGIVSANECCGFDWTDVVKIVAILAGAVCVAEVLS
jgi:hypothetical protein